MSVILTGQDAESTNGRTSPFEQRTLGKRSSSSGKVKKNPPTLQKPLHGEIPFKRAADWMGRFPVWVGKYFSKGEVGRSSCGCWCFASSGERRWYVKQCSCHKQSVGFYKTVGYLLFYR